MHKYIHTLTSVIFYANNKIIWINWFTVECVSADFLKKNLKKKPFIVECFLFFPIEKRQEGRQILCVKVVTSTRH